MNTASAFPAKTTVNPPSRRVTDAPTRVFHALFALSFTGAYLTGDSERWRMLHLSLGYTLAGLLVFRVFWGLFGPRQTRLSLLAHKLGGWSLWVQELRRGRFNARHGQNLLMASAGVALLVLALPLALSGYIAFADWTEALGWADAVAQLHQWVANSMLAVLGLHLGLIAVLSWLRGWHHATTMFHGRIPGRGPDLAIHNHSGIALILWLSVCIGWLWPWI
jgi:cytochrome b